MERFARIIVGYHGCSEDFARKLLLGKQPIADWKPSENRWDWLGKGIYFWEHSPERALRWAQETFRRHRTVPSVVGAIIQLGDCFDLTNEGFVAILGDSFKELANAFEAEGLELPKNTKAAGKRRELDCLAINHCLERLEGAGRRYDSVRGAFLEGPPVFEGTTISKETHIQVAVRNPACILGVFRPNSSE
jgi:hypothetical protein